MKLYLSFICLLFVPFVCLAQSANSENLTRRASFWWQADSLGAGPVINGHPTAEAKEIQLSNHLIHSSALSVFTVYVPDDEPQEQILWSLKADDELNTVLTTHRLAQLQRGDYRNFRDTAIVPARLHSYYARLAKENLTLQLLPAVPSEIPVQRFGGSLAEVIIFDAVLSPLERQRVETYLAIKYGLTLATDYVDRSGNTLQPILEGEHVWRVAGVGHDPFFSSDERGSKDFRQNQSHSIFAPELLSLRTEGELTPGSFLLVADDDAPLALTKPGALQPLTSQRSWQVTTTQWSTDNSLFLEVDTSAFAKTPVADHHWWIRHVAEDLPATYAPLLEEGGEQPVFKLSVPAVNGTSIFQVVYGPALLPNVELDPPTCASNSQGEVRIAAAALHFPVRYAVYDDADVRLASGELTDAEAAAFVQLAAGAYRLEMEDAQGVTFSESWFFQASDAPALELEAEYFVAKGETLELNPPVEENTSIEWKSAAGEELSFGASFATSTPGEYEVFADRDGCLARYTFTVHCLRNQDNIADLMLWPNPSPDGFFNLQADLHQAAPAEVTLVDVTGRVLHRQPLTATTTRHTFQGRVLHKGMYFVRFETRESAEVRKLVVE